MMEIFQFQRIAINLKKRQSDLLVCYGDEIANINYRKIFKKHYQSKKLVTLTTIKVKSNFGFLRKNNDKYQFIEKPEVKL